MNNRLVLLAGPGESTNILFHAIHALHPFVRVIVEQPIPRVEFIKRRAKRLGWPRVIGQVLFQSLLVPILRRQAAGRIAAIKRQFGLNDAAIPAELVIHVDSANSPATMDLLRELNPDLILINGTRILSEKLLNSIPAPFVNIHAGITPMYRGVHGAYWALVEGKPDACGVTVHFVDKGIDTGKILAQGLINPAKGDNFTTYPLLQLARGLDLLHSLLPELLTGKLASMSGPSGRSLLRSHPTIFEYLRYRFHSGIP